jgi:hypothetical protein
MNESKTPRTDALYFSKTPPSVYDMAGLCKHLETENAEIKAENIRITKLRDHDFEELAELAELKRQIAEGELIPFDMIRPILGAWHSKDCKSDNFLEFTKEFAKREAGAK